jgi:hypothetical protein
MLFLVFFKQEFAIVHYTTNWRFSVRHNLYQIKIGIDCGLLCFSNRYYPNLFTLGANQTNFWRGDVFVQANLFFCSDTSTLQSTAAATRDLCGKTFNKL